jgi:Kef-type K+ transport system membrane component KefB
VHEQHAFPFLREILLFLTLAGILIPPLQRLRINQVLGFLAAGALAGPFGLGLLAPRFPWLGWLTFPAGDGVSALGELGVLFLMFMIGLELSMARLWAMRGWVFGIGGAQVVLSAAALGAALYLAGQRITSAAILGLVLSLSSTAVVMQLLTEQHNTGSKLGQAAFAVLMLQDLAVVPLLIVIGALGKGSGDIEYVAFEINAKLVAQLCAEGFPVYFGNAARAELLRHVSAGDAPAIVLTMDHPASALHAVRGIRREFPDVPLFARARDERNARALASAGATVVVPETMEASLQLSKFVLQAMGIDDARVDDIIDTERGLFVATLAHAAEHPAPADQPL